VYLAIEGSDKPPRQCEPSIVGATESGVEGSPRGRRGGPRTKKEEAERERERGRIREAASPKVHAKSKPTTETRRVLLTNFSVCRRFVRFLHRFPILFLPLLHPPPSLSLSLSRSIPLTARRPDPPLLQLISSRPRRSGTPMFGQLLIPTARDSPAPPAPPSSSRHRAARNPLLARRSFRFSCISPPSPLAPHHPSPPPPAASGSARGLFLRCRRVFLSGSRRTTCAHPTGSRPPLPSPPLPRVAPPPAPRAGRFLPRGRAS
jgi:hypothetical protein